MVVEKWPHSTVRSTGVPAIREAVRKASFRPRLCFAVVKGVRDGVGGLVGITSVCVVGRANFNYFLMIKTQ